MIKYTEKIDLNQLQNQKCVSLGTLSPEIIDFLKTKRPDVGNLLSDKEEIVFWNDRISHTEDHKDDFVSDALFYKCFENIPAIIRRPDYISVHKTGKSISFIRTVSQNVAVVIRVTTAGKMAYRTMYPLMSAQLDNYINSGNAWEYAKNI